MDSMVRRISRLAKALKWKIYHFLVCFFCASVDVGRFLKTRFRPWIHQPSESFGLTLATETTFNSNFCSKTARYRLFLAVVRCCVTTTLAAETFGLLNVYLNYKFGLGLPSFYLFFSLFKNKSMSYEVSASRFFEIFVRGLQNCLCARSNFV